MAETRGHAPRPTHPALFWRDPALCIVFALILATVAFTRLTSLGDRPFSHDESLFAYYGWQLARTGNYLASETDDEPAEGEPTHHPLLHGPLQIQILGGMFRLGSLFDLVNGEAGDAAARLPAAIAGILLVAGLALLLRPLGRQGVLIAAALLAVSPSVWYYSRFCRNEALFLLATLLFVEAVRRAARAPRADAWTIAAWALAAVLVALKENAWFLLFAGATFSVFMAAHQRLRRPARWRRRFGLWPNALQSLRTRPWAWLAGAALAGVVLEAVYTNGFQWNTNFVRMYAQNLSYWWGQHAEHRIYGEFHYHLLILALYEPLILLTLLFGAVRLVLGPPESEGGSAWPAIITFAVVAAGYLLGATLIRLPAEMTSGNWEMNLLDLLHMSQPWHSALALAVLWLTALGALRALETRRPFRAWLVWWCGVSFLQYGYAGEKVPWLSVNITLPAALLTADLLADWWRKQYERFERQEAALFVIVLLLCLTGLQGWRLCLVDPVNPAELLVYNTTQRPVVEIAYEMRHMAEQSNGRLHPFIQGEAAWPLVWYLRDLYYEAPLDSESPRLDLCPLLVCDNEYAAEHEEIARRYDLRHIPLRCAWTPRPLQFLQPWQGADSPRNPLWYLQRLGLTPGEEEYFAQHLPDDAELSPPSRQFLERARESYGLRAWGALLRYIVLRRPWGDPQVCTEPFTVTVGRRPYKTAPMEDITNE